MWINSEATQPFAFNVYVGGVNAISGEAMIETEETAKRRSARLTEKKPIQDYIVPPNQLWLDGIANADGTVRQFVAMTKGSDYSVEAQVTGQDLICGLQFEIIPQYTMKRVSTPAPHVG
ncbi:hypothetical protein LTS18_000440, partial [Coniosporium uncinatum]